MKNYTITVNGTPYNVTVEEGTSTAAAPVAAPVQAPAPQAAPTPKAAPAPAGAGSVKVDAPMPGNIVSLEVKVGDSVAEGDVVAVMEAMKMNVEVVAPCAGVVKQITVEKGAVVATDDALMII